MIIDDGIYLANKPKNISSAKFLDFLKSKYGIKKLGHAGTLDPFANGLMIVGVGKYTKSLSKYVGLDKSYIVKMMLGYSSNTFDLTGEIIEVNKEIIPTIENINEILSSVNFIGEIRQIPPNFSAKKIGGMRAYKLARDGVEFKLDSVNVKIYENRVLDYSYPYLTLKISVSSGTYIRSIVDNLGKCLKCGAYAVELERISIDTYSLDSYDNIKKII